MMYVDLAAAIILAFVLRAVWMLRARPLINVVVARRCCSRSLPTFPHPRPR